jgi:hypothetical protein
MFSFPLMLLSRIVRQRVEALSFNAKRSLGLGLARLEPSRMTRGVNIASGRRHENCEEPIARAHRGAMHADARGRTLETIVDPPLNAR